MEEALGRVSSGGTNPTDTPRPLEPAPLDEEPAGDPAESIRALLNSLLFPARVSREEEAAFRAHERPENVANWRAMVLAVSVFALLWWPTDLLFFHGSPAIRHAFSVARGISAEAGLLTWLFLPRVRFMRRHALGFLGLVGLITCAVTSYELGQLGGPHELWFNFLYALVLTPIAISVSLRERLVWTGAFAATLVLGYFGLHPGYLRQPFAGSELAYLFFISLMSVWSGLLLDRLRRRNFFLRRRSARDAQALFDLNRHLNARVDEQTSELRRLTQSTESARESERARIARELHDELGQDLTALRYELKVARIRTEREPAAMGEELDELEELVRRATETTRSIVTHLRPKLLDDLGLFAAAEFLARETKARTGLTCRLSLPTTEMELPPEIASTAFRVLQESLTNVARHARAQEVALSLGEQDGTLSVEVEDDGAGFMPGRKSSGVGLIGMRERVRHVGGTIEIDSAPGHGTRVRARLPLAISTKGAS